MTSPAANTPDAAEAWTSTVSADQAAAWLADKRKLLLVTHTKIDGDAAGSTLALARALRLAAMRTPNGSVMVRPLYHGPRPRWAAEVVGETKVRWIEQEGLPPADGEWGDPDAIVVVDTGSWSQIEFAKPLLEGRADRTLVIDHHRHGDAEIGTRRLVETHSAAVCQPVADLCVRLLGVSGPAELPLEIATPLFLGIATDTGWFKHASTDARVLRLAADLREAGVDAAWLYSLVEQRERPSRLRLLAKAFSSLEFFAGEQACVMTIFMRDIEDAHANPGETGGFLDLAQTVESVRVAALLTEAPPEGGAGPITKISLRSKAGPDLIDVNDICRRFGGGGHKQAAGARIRLPMDEARKQVMAAITEALT
ncbi:MAG: DHH family phosphoesterase [Phycisphaerales bacterium]|nr:DHH family phosphoesterase [Phycisphaerales bacterium]